MAGILRALAFALIVAVVVLVILSIAPRCKKGDGGLTVGSVLMAGSR
jgi:hypothetical protein